jgi:hypothetical protein
VTEQKEPQPAHIYINTVSKGMSTDYLKFSYVNAFLTLFNWVPTEQQQQQKQQQNLLQAAATTGYKGTGHIINQLIRQ